MVLSKVKTALAVVLAVGVVAGAGVVLHERVAADSDAKSQAQAVKPQAVPGAKLQAAQDVNEEKNSVICSGRVLDPEGKPVAKARLYLPRWLKERQAGQNDVAVVERVTTDRDGRFQLKLPRKEAQPGRPVPLVAAADGFGLAWVDLPQDGPPGDLTLRLVKDVPIRGRIVTPEGRPVTGVTVNVMGILAVERLDDFLRVYQRERGRHVDEGTGIKRLDLPLNKVVSIMPSDRQGRFEIRGIGAERLAGLEVKSAALAQDMIAVVTREGLDVKSINKAVAANAPPGERVPVLFGPSFDHVSVPARAIEGTVREAGSGNPVAGVTVSTVGIVAVTDAQGRYRLTGMRKSEEYTLQATAPKSVPLIGRWVKVPGAPSLEPIKADIDLARGVIVTGRVIDKVTGKGVESSVHFSPLPENKVAPENKVGSTDQSLYTFTDAEGRFRLVTIPGPGVVLAGVVGRTLKINGVPIYPYKQAEFDTADRPRVKMSDALKPYRSFVVAGGGFETLDMSNACKVLDLKEGGDPVTCDLVMDPGKSMTVNLQDPEGKPLTGVLAAGISAGAIRAVPLSTATCPVYALDPEKPRQMVFLHAGRKLATMATVRGDEKDPVTVRLAPTGTVTGRALDGDGQPVAGAEVHVNYGSESGRQLTKMAFSRILGPHTDKQGRFRLEGIVPGLEVEFIGFLKGRKVLVPQTQLDLKQLQSGKTLNLGDIRTKPREP